MRANVLLPAAGEGRDTDGNTVVPVGQYEHIVD